MRMFLALLLALMSFSAPAKAQDPQVTFELDVEETVVGQPVTLRIKVLVPTWLPKPAVFPTIEIPSLMVRLPERATVPVSETIDRETWSGVQRSYRLYPLAAGSFTLPDGNVIITYADPDQTDPITYQAPLPTIRFTATVPKGAAGLNSVIIAADFQLEQSLEGETELNVGDAITRTITAHINGTTAVLIPELTPETDTNELRAYAREPVITETEDRGNLSGTRVETATYVGQKAGSALLPELAIDWFNLTSGKVETAALPATNLTVSGAMLGRDPPTGRDFAVWTLLAGLSALGLWVIWRFAHPWVRAKIIEMKTAYNTSERAAYQRLTRAISDNDLSRCLSATQDWLAFFPMVTSEDSKELEQVLAVIGAAEYGSEPAPADHAWLAARSAVQGLRAQLTRESGSQTAETNLPPLNP